MRLLAAALYFLLTAAAQAFVVGQPVGALNPQIAPEAGITQQQSLNFAQGGYPISNGTCGSYGHFVPCALTTIRASTGYVNTPDGVWWLIASGVQRVAAGNGLLIEEARTDSIRVNDGTGASGATGPNNWTVGGAGGLTATWTPAVMNGLSGVSVRFQGTDSSGFITIFPDSNGTTIAAANGQTWSPSAFIALTAGTLPGSINNFNLQIREKDGGGATLVNDNGTGFQGSINSTLKRFYLGGTTDTGGQALTGGATIAFVSPIIAINYTLGSVIDMTLFLAPQFELGASTTSPIKTSGSTVTRAGDVVTLTKPGVFGGAYSPYTKGVNQTIAAYPINADILGINDGTFSNALRLLKFTGSAASAQFRVANTPTNVGGGAWTQNVTGKAAAAYAAGDQAFSFNGAAVATGAITMNAVNTVQFGGTAGAASSWNGFVSEAAIAYQTRYPSQWLQNMTPVVPAWSQ